MFTIANETIGRHDQKYARKNVRADAGGLRTRFSFA
jgi:hypothetical protein